MKALNMSVFAAALLLLAGIPVGAQTSGAKAAAEADKYLKRLVKVPGPFGICLGSGYYHVRSRLFMRRLCASGKTEFRRIFVYCGLPRN